MSLALLRDAVRSLASRSGPTLAAVSGLSLAMAACLIVAMLAIALASPDPDIPDPQRVVLLDMKGNPPGMPSPWFTASPVSFATMLKERRVPLDLITRVSANDFMSLALLEISIDGRLQTAQLLTADPDVLPLLGLKALRGDLQRTLMQHDGMAITTDLLRKLWGELPPEQAIGRRINARGRVYSVTAIVPNIDPRSPLWGGPLLEADNPAAGRAVAIAGFESANAMRDGDRKAIFAINGRVFARLRDDTSLSAVGEWMREAFEANPLYAQLPADWRTGR